MAIAPLRVLILDNYDSYTQNLRHQIARVSATSLSASPKLPHVIPNDAMRADALIPLLKGPSRIYDAVIISPGPGSPRNARDAGVCLDVLRECVQTPILGVCFGHQALAHVHGGQVQRAREGGVHGRLSRIRHASNGLFRDIPCGFEVVRYHSLAVEPETLPGILEPIAWVEDDYPTVMALKHRMFPHYGVQFHPESICTTFGDKIIRNFLEICREEREKTPSIVIQNSPNVKKDAPTKTKTSKGKLRLRYHKRPWKSTEYDLPKVLQAVWRTSVKDKARWALNDQAATEDSFWLDTATTAEKRGRFSIMGFPGGPLWRKLSYSIHQATEQSLHGVETLNGTSHRAVHGDPWMAIDHKIQGSLQVSDSSGDTRSTVLTENEGLFAMLEREMNTWEVTQEGDSLPFAFRGGFVGYFGYEMKAECGSRSSLTMEEGFELATSAPTASLFFADRFIVLDYEEENAYFCALSTNSESNGYYPDLCTQPIDLEASSSSTAEDWIQKAEKAFRGTTSAETRENKPSAGSITEHLRVKSLTDTAPSLESRQLRWRTDLDSYRENIREAMGCISAGETYEVCLTNQLQGTLKTQFFNPILLHAILRDLNPAPYSAFLHFGRQGDENGSGVDETAICCSSPERFLRVRERRVETKPIKGTTRRSADRKEDRALAEALLNSEKERAENMMIVDLLRNDLGRVCRAGSVVVPHLMEIESYKSVHQLVSTIRGELDDSRSSLDVLRACFPGGSMTGAPKFRTMEIIDNLEKGPRGVYSGTIGYLSLNGDMDLNIVIRTIVMTLRDTALQQIPEHMNGQGEVGADDHRHPRPHHNNRNGNNMADRRTEASVSLQIGAGGAITLLSSVEDEVDELLLKAERVAKAVELYLALDSSLSRRQKNEVK